MALRKPPKLPELFVIIAALIDGRKIHATCEPENASLGKNTNNGNVKLSKKWLRGLDLNQRPSGYEPDELPDCSTPRHQNCLTCRLAFLA